MSTTRDMANTTVTATVETTGAPADCNCPTSASASGDVLGNPTSTQTDDFGKGPDDDVKARVDGFFLQLNTNPSAQGYVINYGTPAQIKARRAQIMKAINRPGSGHDASRVTFVDGPDDGTGIRTKFYVVPAGADRPNP